MDISQKTIGLLIDYLDSNTSQVTLGGVLKRHNLGDADPGVDSRPFSRMSKAKRADLALGAAFESKKMNPSCSTLPAPLFGIKTTTRVVPSGLETC